MRDEPRQVTTFCPRCGSPIVWSVQAFAGGEQIEVAGWVCSCPLDDDEWDDLADEAADALDDGDAGDDDRARSRVAEEPPL
jgi:hypothetical protein